MTRTPEQKARRRERDRQYRRNLAAAGICMDCGKNPIREKKNRRGRKPVLCEPCMTETRKRFSKQKETALAAGLCIRCRKIPHEEGKLQCATCVKSSDKYRKNFIHRGLCSVCGGKIEKNREKFQNCVECARVHKERLVKLRIEYVQDGICAECAQHPAQEDSAICTVCAKKKNAYSLNRMKRFMANGLCCACGKRPPAENRTRCKPCLVQRRKSEAKRRARKRPCRICRKVGGGNDNPNRLCYDCVDGWLLKKGYRIGNYGYASDANGNPVAIASLIREEAHELGYITHHKET